MCTALINQRGMFVPLALATVAEKQTITAEGQWSGNCYDAIFVTRRQT